MSFFDRFLSSNRKFSKDCVGGYTPPSIPLNLADKELELDWKRVTMENMSSYESFFQEMSTWSSDPAIKKYISSSITLDNLMKMFVRSRKESSEKSAANLYLCTDENGEFVGFSYITTPIGQNPSSVVEYLIVNPNFRNKGVGTRMIKSIVTNSDYFNMGKSSDGFSASVESCNIPSTHAFLKNKFRVVSSNFSDTAKHYQVLYFSKERDRQASDEYDFIQ